MDFKSWMNKLGLFVEQDLRITESQLKKQWETCEAPSQELTMQLAYVSNVLAYPEDYGYEVNNVTEEVIAVEEEDLEEDINAVVCTGKHPPRRDYPRRRRHRS